MIELGSGLENRISYVSSDGLERKEIINITYSGHEK